MSPRAKKDPSITSDDGPEKTLGESIVEPLARLVSAVDDFEFALADLAGVDNPRDAVKMAAGVLDEMNQATDLLEEAYPTIPRGDLRDRARKFLRFSDREAGE